jgi:restriction endonuclease
MSDEENTELPFPEGLPRSRVYELVVKNVIERLEPGATIRHDARVPVVGDDRTRQVYVYIEGRIAGFSFTVVVDTKHYAKPLDVKAVDEFLGMLDDIRPNMGVLVSLRGVGSGAKKLAAKEGRRLNLCSVFLGKQPDFSAPIGIGIISVIRTDLEVKMHLDGGLDFTGPIEMDPVQWKVVDIEGERWRVLDLVASALNTHPELVDVEEGSYAVSNNAYKLLCTDESQQTFESLDIEFRSKLPFFRRSTRFDTGVAILDGDGAVIASTGLGTTVPVPSEAEPWEEISAEDAKAGLMAELQ